MKNGRLALILSLLTVLVSAQQNLPAGQTTTLNTENIVQASGFAPGSVMTIKGAYESGVTYATGDAVTYAGSVYLSLVASNIGHQPDTSGAQWARVAVGTSFAQISGKSETPNTESQSYFDPIAINESLGISTTATWTRQITNFDYQNGNFSVFAINTKAANSQFQYPVNQPFLLDSKQFRRWNMSDGFTGLQINQTVLSGTNNDVNEGKNNIAGESIKLDVYSAGQLGGHRTVIGHHTSHGDSVLRSDTYTDVGCSDEGDECQENDRIFHYISPLRFGGTLASVGSPNVSGNVPMQVTVTRGYTANQAGDGKPLRAVRSNRVTYQFRSHIEGYDTNVPSEVPFIPQAIDSLVKLSGIEPVTSSLRNEYSPQSGEPGSNEAVVCLNGF